MCCPYAVGDPKPSRQVFVCFEETYQMMGFMLLASSPLGLLRLPLDLRQFQGALVA